MKIVEEEEIAGCNENATVVKLKHVPQSEKLTVGICTGDGKNKEDKRVIANWGDTLWSLADDHHVSADEIRRSNNLPSVYFPTLGLFRIYKLLCSWDFILHISGSPLRFEIENRVLKCSGGAHGG